MLGQQVEGSIPEHIRQRMFHLLVTAQDMEMSVAESRRMITDKFGVSEDQIRRIEREGMQRGWLGQWSVACPWHPSNGTISLDTL